MNILNTNSWDDILNSMIIIGGSARSGTTIIGKLINSLNNVEYYFEPPMLNSLLLKKDELSNQSLKELLEFYFFDNFLLDSLAGRNINLNPNDDSSILNVKTDEEIRKRHIKSYPRVELEKISKTKVISFKLPSIVFFLQTMTEIFPQNRTILMHRDPNEVINSLIKKNWFSDQSLNVLNPTQAYAVKIVKNLKIPYWVKDTDIDFWVNSNEINRSAYYYKRVSEEILTHSKNSSIVDYNKFIEAPKETMDTIANILDLDYTSQTEDILKSVKYQKKQRSNLIDKVEETTLKDIISLDQKLKKLSI